MLRLSFAQQRLWLLDHFDGAGAAYNIPVAVRLRGEIRQDALAAALGDVVARHEVLRTVYPAVDGAPVQRVIPVGEAPVPFQVEPCAPQDAAQRLREAAATVFRLGEELPLKGWLFEISSDESLLVLVVHHIASDGWSTGPLWRDLALSYAARCEGREPLWPQELPVQYADYALWQREWLGSEDDQDSEIARQLAFWREELAGLTGELRLPTDRPRPAVNSYRGDAVPVVVDPAVHRDIVRLARESRTTTFMVVQATLAVLLTRLGAGADIAIGSATAGRSDEQLDDLIGCFVNTLVLRSDTSGDPTFRDLLARTRTADLAAYAHQDVPFERLVEMLNPTRSTARQPFFQVTLAVVDQADAPSNLHGVQVTAEPVQTTVAKLDLALLLAESFDADGAPAGLRGELSFATDLFDRSTAENLVDRLAHLLTEAVPRPDVPISRIGLLSEAERRHVVEEWNRTAVRVGARTLPELIAEQADVAPEAVALVHRDAELTYAELDGRVDRLARLLVERGVGAERFVAVALPRGMDAYVAVLAVLRAGGAYVPVDVAHPDERIAFILADVRPVVTLTTTAYSSRLPKTAGHIVAFDDDAVRQERAGAQDGAPAVVLRPEDPAYVIYTSGSTGRPKGVVVTHAGLGNLAAFAGDRCKVDGNSRVLQSSSLSFDASVFEMCMTFSAGAALVVPTGPLAGTELGLVLREQAITHAVLVPGLLATVPAQPLPDLRVLLLGGEAVSEELVARWSQGRLMFNAYGPTEATVAVSCSEPLDAGEVPSIGRPVWNTQAYVLDAELRPVPAGVVGELYVSGPGLARGYLNRPALTAERFVANPFGTAGGRMYRTGDLARWRARGELEFAGRADQQVKVRGLRIELGEIESVMREHAQVGDAAVVVREDRSGQARIVAFVVPSFAGTRVPAAELKEHAAQRLPAYMVPDAFVSLGVLPITGNGKVDREALQGLDLESAAPTPSGVAPRNRREETLARIWARLLELPGVGVDDNFFELGGHSLLCVQLVWEINQDFGVDISTREVFESPTVAGLAVVVEAAMLATLAEDDSAEADE